MVPWGAWALAAALLVLAVILFVQWWRRKRGGWRVAGAGVVLVGLGLLVAGWYAWSGQTAEQFIDLVAHRQFDEANRFLPPSSRWQVGQDGSVSIRAEDGSSITLPADSLPLAAAQSHRPASSERWAGRWPLALGTLRRPTCTIFCTAEYGKVYCHKVEEVGEGK